MATLLTTSRFRFPSDYQKTWQRYSFAALSVLAAVGIRYILGFYLPALSSDPFVLLYPAVLFAVWYGGFGPGIFATTLAVILADYLFIPPPYQFTKPMSALWLQLALFVGVNSLMAYLADNLRRALVADNQSSRKLLEYRNKIFNILQSVQGCFFSVDRNGNFIHINEDCHNYLKDVASFLGKNVWQAFPDWKNTEFGSKFREAIVQRRSLEFEFHDLKESRWHEVHISPASEGLSVHIFDATSRKNVEARLSRSEENLRLANEELERRVELRTFELARANIELKNEISERQKVEKEALEIIQKEQRRFSSQLHDGLCQNLTGIMMMAKALTRKLEKKSVGEAAGLRTIAELVNRSVTDARDMARGLFPVELEANSLMFSLHGLSLRTESLFQVHCRFHCPEPILLKNNVTATHLFRITQEAVQNAISHGNAKNIQISLARDDGKIVLEVQDDGEGLSEDLKVSAGIGLQIMKYRARMLDASLGFEKLNHGTLFTCTVPIHEE